MKNRPMEPVHPSGGTDRCVRKSNVRALENKRIYERFGGKRALGFLLKSELCQKRSKFRMQFCLRVSNNALHVFPLKFASFLKYYVCGKTHFSEGTLWGSSVE